MLPGCPAIQRQKLDDDLPLRFSAPEDGRVQPGYLAREAVAATITVHEPDGEGRVFVDVVGQINDDDFKTFKEKTWSP